MRTSSWIAVAVAVAAAGVGFALCSPSWRDAPTPSPPAEVDTATGIAGDGAAAVHGSAPPEDAARAASTPRAARPLAPAATADATPAMTAAAPDAPATTQTTSSAVVWPFARAGGARGGDGAGAPAGTPSVPVKIAFRALWYVGVDPEAEKIWLRAINDPAMPPGVRSDLIEDLNDEGYTDNSNPGPADLPMVVARLELIERLAPYAIDQVNRDAFEEAYKDLLAIYERLGGAPRAQKQ